MEYYDLSVISKLVEKSRLNENGSLSVTIADDLFLKDVGNILSQILSSYLDSSLIKNDCIILRMKPNLPDYNILKVLRSLKLPMSDRGKFIIINKDL